MGKTVKLPISNFLLDEPHAHADKLWGPYPSLDAAAAAIPTAMKVASFKFGVISGGVFSEYIYLEDNGTPQELASLKVQLLLNPASGAVAGKILSLDNDLKPVWVEPSSTAERVSFDNSEEIFDGDVATTQAAIEALKDLLDTLDGDVVKGILVNGSEVSIENGVASITIPDAITSVITNHELVLQTPDGQSVKGKVGVTTGADGLLHLTLTDEDGNTYSSPIAGLRVNGNELQYSNDGETWVTVQTFGKLTIKYVQASDPVSGDVGDLALVGSTNAYVLKVYVGGSWVSVGDFSTLDLTSDGITMVGLNKTLTDVLIGVETIAEPTQSNLDCTKFTRTNGYAIGSDGKAYSVASGKAVSEYIAIAPNTQYACMSSVWDKNANIGLAFYSEQNEDSYIDSSFRYDTVNNVGKTSGTVPANANYIRVTWPNGTSGFYPSQNYLKYYKQVTQAYDKIIRMGEAVAENAQNIQTNANDIDNIQSELHPIVWKECVMRYGARVGKSGNNPNFYLIGASNYYAQMFDVEEGDIFRLSGYNGTYSYPYAITDENGLAVGGTGTSTGGSTSTLVDKVVEIPSGAKYLFVGFVKDANHTSFKVEKLVQKTILYDIEGELSVSEDEEIGYTDATISSIRIYDSSFSDSGNSAYIPIKEGAKYKITANSNKYTNYAFLQSIDNLATGNTPIFAAGFTKSVSISPSQSVTIQVGLDAKYLFVWCSNGDDVHSPASIVMLNSKKSIEDRLDEIERNNIVGCTYKDATNLQMFGSSITASASSPVSWSWIERLNDIVDVLIENRGVSGSGNKTNIVSLAANTAHVNADGTAYDSELGKPAELNPHFIMFNNSANGTASGGALVAEYDFALSIVRSYGAKMLIGCEPWNFSENNGNFDRGQKSFLSKNPEAKGLPIQFYLYRHFLDGPYHGFVDFNIMDVHPGYRCQTPMIQHSELISLLPIRKSVKMWKVRPNLTVNSVNDLCYDTNEQRLLYFHSINCGVQRGDKRSAGISTAHADNVDYNYTYTQYDVPNGVNSNFGTSETAALKRGHSITFNTWALCEFILDKVKVTKGIFTIKSDVAPTGVYVAYMPRVYDSSSTIRTKWLKQYVDYSDGTITCIVDRNGVYDFELYDKVRILINYADGDMVLSQPCFTDYDGVEKPADNRLETYHFRKYGTELMDKTSVEDGWTLAGTAAVKAFPAEIANYPTGWTHNNTKQHITLVADGDTMQKTVSLGGNKGNKVAIRVECQIFPKIATTREFSNMSAEELAEYIETTKPTIKEYDYCWQHLVLTVNGGTQQKKLVSVGWQELYFEVDLESSDTNLAITIGRQSGWSNADLPMLIYNVSAQVVE